MRGSRSVEVPGEGYHGFMASSDSHSPSPASPFSPAERLREERARVEERLAGVYAGFTPSDGLGFGKRVGDGTQIAVERITDVGKQEALLRKLAAITAAEEKLAEGTYGECETCGSPIGVERLDFLPFATHCVAHAR